MGSPRLDLRLNNSIHPQETVFLTDYLVTAFIDDKLNF